ncbi:hypothetical protein [Nocardioides currus]|uniref:Uncharacterized protein n=1 Tax=Nocardioides currus TaxID=2133958 RepID=A0A2R7Z2P6_9ACTN|nr:hypothetical protein [Nocardioides currus]PUA82905.1 hypothetical protein C7S10_04175 [Nocardioides currus]
MISGRRIAAALVAAVLSLGAIGVTAGPAQALKDTTWPVRPAPDTTQTPGPTVTPPDQTDTTWPAGT